MTDYRKSNSKHWCDVCDTFIRDTPQERKAHDSSAKHKSSIERKIREKAKKQQQEAKKQQIQAVSQLKQQIQEPTSVTNQKKVEPKNAKYKNKPNKQSVKAQMLQEQFNQYYSSGKTNSSSGPSLPLLSLDQSYLQDEKKENQTHDLPPEESDAEELQEEQELRKLKAKQTEYEDDYYNNPDFFFTEESAEFDEEEIKKQEEEIKLKKIERKREKEEEELKKKLEFEKKIQDNEYIKKMDVKTGLGKWEDLEEYTIEEETPDITEDVKKEEEKEVKQEETENILKFSFKEEEFDDNFVVPSFKIEAENNPVDKKKLFHQLANEEKEEKMVISDYNYSESKQAKKRKLNALDDLLK
jgi:hypothetical protein